MKDKFTSEDKKVLDIIRNWDKYKGHLIGGMSLYFISRHSDAEAPTTDHIARLAHLSMSKTKYKIDKLRKLGLVDMKSATTYTGYYYHYYIPTGEEFPNWRLF